MLPLEYYFVASRFVNKIKILNRHVVGLVFSVFLSMQWLLEYYLRFAFIISTYNFSFCVCSVN
jgi:hypothetical protein